MFKDEKHFVSSFGLQLSYMPYPSNDVEGVVDVEGDTTDGDLFVCTCGLHALNRGARTSIARERIPRVNAYLIFMSSISPL